MFDRQYINWRSPENAAAELAGNWDKDSTIYHSFHFEVRAGDEYRESEAILYELAMGKYASLLDRTNDNAILEALKEKDKRGASWYVDSGYLVLFPYRKNGQLTTVWFEFCDLMYALCDYPLLDDEAYYEGQKEEAIEPAMQELAHDAERYCENYLDRWDIEVLTQDIYALVSNEGWMIETSDNNTWAYIYTNDHLDYDKIVERVALWVILKVDAEIEAERLNLLESRGELYTQLPLIE